MLKDELFDKTIEMNSSRSSGDITILEEHLNDDVTIIGERGGRRSKRSADLAEIKSAQTQKKVKVLLRNFYISTKTCPFLCIESIYKPFSIEFLSRNIN